MTSHGWSSIDPGDEFQETFWALLRYAYPPQDIVPIPATMGGDFGIEGYTTDGIAYQCFADRDSLNLGEQTRKQRAKMNEDTLKLQKNAGKLSALLGDAKIKWWFLIVPKHDSAELVLYAKQRSLLVRSWNLPFIDPSFEIRLKTPDDYHEQARALVRDGLAHVAITFDLNEEEVALFPGTKPELVAVLDDKLSRVAQNNGEAVALRDRFIRAYLEKEKILDALRDWPEMIEAIETRRTLKERQLELESLLSPDEPYRRVLTVYQDYQADLRGTVAAIRDVDAERIASGQIGEWLMRCPLRFRVPA